MFNTHLTQPEGKTRAFMYDLSSPKRLLVQGFIEMTLPHMSNRSLQKYRLTPTGHTLLSNQ